jgi:geranylgeranyl diphosphate synthase, type II
VADPLPIRSVTPPGEAILARETMPARETISARAASLPVLIKASVEHALDDAFPSATIGPARLVEAMRYGLLAPAKRVRGVLTCLVARQFGADPKQAASMAVAIEMVHAASLVLDDLPCMDDAAIRRGRPAAHRIYGEDTAVLAAVGLMNQAYGCLARDADLPAELRTQLSANLADAIGANGLVGGQEQDMREAGRIETVADVELMHARKTGILFQLAAEAGARIARASEAQALDMRAFGARLGLAFQTYDDVLDAHATIEIAGKDVGKDSAKVTVVTLLGVGRAKAHADAHVAAALAHLEAAGGDVAPTTAFVRSLIDQLVARAPRISGG